ncbi:GntR family transcriptional regulator [Altererythrobacter sp. ZODW24]|uniref:GntR family transcriptional regulator n=1 Tax=Altererythrobacter sp. ZODW24 TaxID=2185142 RepID=UPI000DF814CB|nr:GntR family transcriptional regulator [Altererythrobacter sp. ZODW24]
MQYTVTRADPISKQAASAIRSLIIEGAIPDGSRINEVHLSKSLGISRTPLREGLGHLVAEHFVEVIPRRGFFAREFTTEEFSNLYDVRPILDPQALLLGEQPNEAEIDRIEKANQAFLDAEAGPAMIDADEHFHRLVWGRCSNTVLLDIIENMMARTRRYELALFRETPRLPVAGDEHAQIIKALREQDLAGAAQALHQNLTTGKEPILDWLSSRLDQKKENS